MLKTVAIGNLGNDCIVRVHNGKKVISFSVAHNKEYKKNGMSNKETIWVNCTYWREEENVSEYLKKGKEVYLEGRPFVKTYTNNEGKVRASFELVVDRIVLVGGNKKEETVKVAVAAQNGTGMENARPDTEAPIPFD